MPTATRRDLAEAALHVGARDLGVAVLQHDVLLGDLHHLGGELLDLLRQPRAEARCTEEPALTAVRAANEPTPSPVAAVSPVTMVTSSGVQPK